MPPPALLMRGGRSLILGALFFLNLFFISPQEPSRTIVPQLKSVVHYQIDWSFESGNSCLDLASIRFPVGFVNRLSLVQGQLHQATVEYENATKAMNEAAAKTQEAIDDLAKPEKAIEKIADAIRKITNIIAKV